MAEKKQQQKLYFLSHINLLVIAEASLLQKHAKYFNLLN